VVVQKCTSALVHAPVEFYGPLRCVSGPPPVLCIAQREVDDNVFLMQKLLQCVAFQFGSVHKRGKF